MRLLTITMGLLSFAGIANADNLDYTFSRPQNKSVYETLSLQPDTYEKFCPHSVSESSIVYDPSDEIASVDANSENFGAEKSDETRQHYFLAKETCRINYTNQWGRGQNIESPLHAAEQMELQASLVRPFFTREFANRESAKRGFSLRTALPYTLQQAKENLRVGDYVSLKSYSLMEMSTTPVAYIVNSLGFVPMATASYLVGGTFHLSIYKLNDSQVRLVGEVTGGKGYELETLPFIAPPIGIYSLLVVAFDRQIYDLLKKPSAQEQMYDSVRGGSISMSPQEHKGVIPVVLNIDHKSLTLDGPFFDIVLDVNRAGADQMFSTIVEAFYRRWDQSDLKINLLPAKGAQRAKMTDVLNWSKLEEQIVRYASQEGSGVSFGRQKSRIRQNDYSLVRMFGWNLGQRVTTYEDSRVTLKTLPEGRSETSNLPPTTVVDISSIDKSVTGTRGLSYSIQVATENKTASKEGKLRDVVVSLRVNSKGNFENLVRSHVIPLASLDAPTLNSLKTWLSKIDKKSDANSELVLNMKFSDEFFASLANSANLNVRVQDLDEDFSRSALRILRKVAKGSVNAEDVRRNFQYLGNGTTDRRVGRVAGMIRTWLSLSPDSLGSTVELSVRGRTQVGTSQPSEFFASKNSPALQASHKDVMNLLNVGLPGEQDPETGFDLSVVRGSIPPDEVQIEMPALPDAVTYITDMNKLQKLKTWDPSDVNAKLPMGIIINAEKFKMNSSQKYPVDFDYFNHKQIQTQTCGCRGLARNGNSLDLQEYRSVTARGFGGLALRDEMAAQCLQQRQSNESFIYLDQCTAPRKVRMTENEVAEFNETYQREARKNWYLWLQKVPKPIRCGIASGVMAYAWAIQGGAWSDELAHNGRFVGLMMYAASGYVGNGSEGALSNTLNGLGKMVWAYRGEANMVYMQTHDRDLFIDMGSFKVEPGHEDEALTNDLIKALTAGYLDSTYASDQDRMMGQPRVNTTVFSLAYPVAYQAIRAILHQDAPHWLMEVHKLSDGHASEFLTGMILGLSECVFSK